MAAASLALRDLLTAPARPGTVLAAFPSAVYVQVTPGAAEGGAGAVVALLARDAVRLPLGLVVGEDAASRPFAGLAAGEEMLVGDGAVQLIGPAPRQWRVQRWWDSRVPVVRPPTATDPPTATEPPGGDRAVDDAVRGLVGLGPGLTPAGDDVLCGALAALTALGDGERRARLAAAVTRHAHRTTTLSAALLHAAADGHGVPELTRLIVAVLRDEPADARRALAAVLAIWHSSGVALATGALLVLRAAHAPATAPGILQARTAAPCPITPSPTREEAA